MIRTKTLTRKSPLRRKSRRCSQAKDGNGMTPQMRDFAIRETGCIASMIWAHKLGIERDPVPCEKHHLNEGDRHGGKRRGERFTVGLSIWAHRGICLCTGAKRNCDVCRAKYGPSWEHEPREFREEFGDGDTLLAYQDARLAEWLGRVVR